MVVIYVMRKKQAIAYAESAGTRKLMEMDGWVSELTIVGEDVYVLSKSGLVKEVKC